jgi:hypothetical protein
LKGFYLYRSGNDDFEHLQLLLLCLETTEIYSRLQRLKSYQKEEFSWIIIITKGAEVEIDTLD